MSRPAWSEHAGLIAAAIARFPATFGLRAFPGKTFKISASASYFGDGENGEPMLYTQIFDETPERYGWNDFAKGTERELRAQMVLKNAVAEGFINESDMALYWKKKGA